MELAYLVMGLMLGSAAGATTLWLVQRGRLRTAERVGTDCGIELAALRAQFDSKSSELTKLEAQIVKQNSDRGLLEERLRESETARAVLDTRLTEERKQAEEKLALLNEARQQLAADFQNLANQILDEKGRKFTEQNQNNLDGLLKPLREQLADFKKRVEDVYDKESRDRTTLFGEIRNLRDLNQRISEDAINLTNALKGQAKTQGTWGEIVLERTLDASGLRKGHEYEVQGSFTDAEGRRLQPDVVVHLPESKDVVIDSKVSLVAYERYVKAKDDTEREAAMRDHIASLRAHINGLSIKGYEGLSGVRTLEFVLMFVPAEAAFLAAIEHDENLFRETFEKRIMIVSPSTLSITLRTIHSIWRTEYQNRNAKLIADKAGQLHDQFVGFVDALEDVGQKQLGKAQESYETARKRLTTGKGNLVNRAKELQDLGAKTKKSLSESLLVQAEESRELPQADEAVAGYSTAPKN